MRGLLRRGKIWRLLLPFSLAAAAIAIFAARGPRGGTSFPPSTGVAPTIAQHPSPSAEERSPQPELSPQVELPRSAGQPSFAPPPAGFIGPATGPSSSAAQLPPRPPEEASPREAPAHSYGPASEAVAPSSQAALRISEPPPAVASAPRPAPAPRVALVPAPEPQHAPRMSSPRPAEPLPRAWARENVRAVRFDAAYYYGRGRSARQLADELTRSWGEKGVNLVYFYAYNRVYGARYRTSYPGNIMEDYGRQDLLGHLLKAAHRRGIKVIAWYYGVQHKQMWEAHPEWRQKTADGRDYKPDPDSYFLCVRNPEVIAWWLGFLDDLLTNYPEADGIDLSESQIDCWGDNACHCQHCRAQFAQAHAGKAPATPVWRRFRAEGLTQALLSAYRLAHRYGKETHLTTVFTARRDGALMASRHVRDATGFDLEAVLASPDRPQVVQAELIWQQWAAVYGDHTTFSPEWTCQAVRQAKELVRGRARLIAHVEITDFGAGTLDGPKLGLTVAAAVRGEPYGIDIYDAHLLDKTEGAARHLQLAWLSSAD